MVRKHQMSSALLALVIVICPGCAVNKKLDELSTPHRRTEELIDLTPRSLAKYKALRENPEKVQFFISGDVVLYRLAQSADTRSEGVSRKGLVTIDDERIRKHETLRIKDLTPGIVVGSGKNGMEDWFDIDVGSGLTLRFKSDLVVFRLESINGQSYWTGREITINGSRYKISEDSDLPGLQFRLSAAAEGSEEHRVRTVKGKKVGSL